MTGHGDVTSFGQFGTVLAMSVVSDREAVAREIGPKLRAARLRAGMTQVQLAAELKIKQQRLSDWERAISQPPLFWIIALCAALRVLVLSVSKDGLVIRVK